MDQFMEVNKKLKLLIKLLGAIDFLLGFMCVGLGCWEWFCVYVGVSFSPSNLCCNGQSSCEVLLKKWGSIPPIKLLDFKCLNIYFFTQVKCKTCYK